MTGTGKQTDPYIVSTWEDFKTAITTVGFPVFIELDADIDMNEVAPSGISTITVENSHAMTIDGKNHAIKNLVVNTGFLEVGSCSIKFYNLKILNFIHRGDNSPFITIGYGENAYFYHCVLSGINTAGVLFKTSGSSYNSAMYFDSTKDGGCTLNIELNTGNFVGCFYLKDSYAKINQRTQTEDGDFGFDNSYLEGTLSMDNFLSSKNSVIDANLIATATSVYTNVIANKDKQVNQYSGLKLVTTEQLTDVEYLKSIGFPIGVE